MFTLTIFFIGIIFSYLNNAKISKEQTFNYTIETNSDENNINNKNYINDKFDLNKADIEQLTSINGIGNITAEKILAYRKINGDFTSFDELLKIDGIGEKTILKISNNAYINTTDKITILENEIPKANISFPININKASYDEFCLLPGIGSSIANKIISYRDNISYFYSVEDIKNVSGIGDKTFEKIKDYIFVDDYYSSQKQITVKFPVDINIANKDELSQIPSISTGIAENIISYRNSVNAFYCIEDIKKVTGIGDKTFEKIKDYISVDINFVANNSKSDIVNININSADDNDLLCIPYMTREIAQNIISYRNNIKVFSNIEELKNVEGITTEIYYKMKDYVYIDNTIIDKEIKFPIDINIASKEELCNIPGIKDGLAENIIYYRNTKEAFYRIEDLKNVTGIGDKTFENIKDYVFVDSTNIKENKDIINYPLDINTANEKELCSIPGITSGIVSNIIYYRNTKEAFYKIEDLKNVTGIGDKTFENIKDYVFVDINNISQEKDTVNFPLNINTASREELCLLPGITPTIAENIIYYRMSNGPIESIDELKYINGLTESIITDINDLIYIINECIYNENNKLNVNTAAADDFCKLPGMNLDSAEKIIKVRTELNGFLYIEELQTVITYEQYKKIKNIITI